MHADHATPASPARTLPLRVLQTSVYRGPHNFSHTPMIRIRLDLGALEDWPANCLPGFTEALLAMRPQFGGTPVEQRAREIHEAEAESALSIHDVRLRVLCQGDRFEPNGCRPSTAGAGTYARAAADR